MKRELQEEMQTDFFYVHDNIVYGVLKKCGISYHHPDYDDYKQTGLLKLTEAYETFPKDLLNEEEYYQFSGYAYQKIRWAIIDEIRKNIKRVERETLFGKTGTQSLPETAVEANQDWLIWELLPSMMDCLEPNEQGYLKDVVFEQLTMTQIAQKHGVSRKTVYEWRKRTAKKLEQFKEVLLH